MEKPPQKLKKMRSNIEKHSDNEHTLNGERRKRKGFTNINEDLVDIGSPTTNEDNTLKRKDLHQIIGCLFCNGQKALAKKLVSTAESAEARELYSFAINTNEPFDILKKGYANISKQRSDISRTKLIALLQPMVKQIAKMYNDWYGSRGKTYGGIFKPSDIRQVAERLVDNFENNSKVKIVGGKIPGVRDGSGPHGMGHEKGRRRNQPCPIDEEVIKEDEDDESDSMYEVTNAGPITLKTFQGFEISDIIDGRRVSKQYIGYSKKDAVKQFEKDFGKATANVSDKFRP